MNDLLSSFNEIVSGSLGFTLKRYQECAAREIVKSLEKEYRFVIVSMPTGSGKTLVEMFSAYYGLNSFSRILVLEPTRFLCDQMCSDNEGGKRGLWNKVFEGFVGKEYEGNCDGFLEEGKKIVISTPQTALKCVSMFKGGFEMIIIDEVHHVFGGRYYAELFTKLKPKVVVGFTALLPSYKRYQLDPDVKNVVGKPYILSYDFKKLEELDPDFKPPKAVADIFDAEMDEYENKVYELFFEGRIEGASNTVKFLEVTLARYGKDVFCQSYRKKVLEGRVKRDEFFDKFCESEGVSHKARMLTDILMVYDVKRNDALKPILIFTSRKAAAEEFKDVIVRHIGLVEDEVVVLTSDVKREEREEVIKRAKNNEVCVIISTLVGEEGIDIPEAGLLIMMDVPKNPLRFYQRLGRLIRMSSPQRMKYLVISLTPKTVEYGDLEDALWNLYKEGVDISHIIVGIEEKKLGSRVLDIISEFSRINNDITVDYTLLAFGQELSNPLTYITELIKGKNLVKPLQEFMKGLKLPIESEEDVVFNLLSNPMYEWSINVSKSISAECREKTGWDALKYNVDRLEAISTSDSMDKKALVSFYNALDNAILRSRFSKEFSRAVMEKKIFYIYDVEKFSEIASYRLKKLHQSNTNIFKEGSIRVDQKSILRLFTRAFLYSNVDSMVRKLKERLEECESFLEKVKGEIFKECTVKIDWGGYNEKNKSYSPKVIIRLKLSNTEIYYPMQINYYDISKEIHDDENIKELIEVNLLTIGYEASKRFIEYLYEHNEDHS